MPHIKLNKAKHNLGNNVKISYLIIIFYYKTPSLKARNQVFLFFSPVRNVDGAVPSLI